MNKFIDWLEGYLEDKLTKEQIDRIKFKHGDQLFTDNVKTSDYEWFTPKTGNSMQDYFKEDGGIPDGVVNDSINWSGYKEPVPFKYIPHPDDPDFRDILRKRLLDNKLPKCDPMCYCTGKCGR